MITKASFSLQNWRVGSVTQFNTVIASAITAPLAHFLTDDVFVCFILFMSQIYEVHEVWYAKCIAYVNSDPRVDPQSGDQSVMQPPCAKSLSFRIVGSTVVMLS